jgi:hypothetical protein
VDLASNGKGGTLGFRVSVGVSAAEEGSVGTCDGVLRLFHVE